MIWTSTQRLQRSTDKFQKACEKLKLEEFDFEDDSPELDDVEDGFFAVADEDMVEEKEKDLEDMLKSFKLNGIIDTDDVESFAFAVKCDGLDDVKDVMKDPEDIADLRNSRLHCTHQAVFATHHVQPLFSNILRRYLKLDYICVCRLLPVSW